MKFSFSSPNNTEEAKPTTSVLYYLIVSVSKFAAAVGAGVVVLMMLVVAYSVVNRYILNTPITWTDELSGYLVVALVMLGAADALRRGDHISVDLITSRLTRRGKRLVEIWGYIVVLVFSSVLLVSSEQTIDYSINFEIVSEGYLEVPMWIPQSFLILGGSLVFLVAFAKLIRAVKRDI
jgi:C4-dicarboxylate transporter DctQ subunit